MEQLNTHPIKKSDLGFHGNLFGGKLLSFPQPLIVVQIFLNNVKKNETNLLQDFLFQYSTIL